MELLPGDVGFTTIGGRTGALVNIGQAIIRDSCRYTHAWIVLQTYKGGAADVLEAMPGGARIRAWEPGHPHEVVPPTRDNGPVYRLPLERWQIEGMSSLTRKLTGTPYSFADYGALALHHLAPNARLTAAARQYVTDSGHMICSQLVDHVLTRAGYHLFDDGRLPQDVTPGDLFYAVADQGRRVA